MAENLVTRHLLFLHIEKAAGSTMHDILYSNFFPYYVTTPVPYRLEDDNQNIYLKGGQLNFLRRFTPNFKAAGGHAIRFYKDVLVFFPNAMLFTMLRDPIDRYISHYFYQNEVMGINRNFEDFLGSSSFSNFTCKKICGEESSEKAFELIEEENVLTGIVERFDESLILLKYQMEARGLIGNFNTSYAPKNERGARTRNSCTAETKSSLLEKFHDRIQENNKEDVVLYDKCLTRFEGELRKMPMQTDAANYLLKPKKIKMGKTVRKLFFVPLERVVGFNVE